MERGSDSAEGEGTHVLEQLAWASANAKASGGYLGKFGYELEIRAGEKKQVEL
jgi:hypothetical protein